MSSNLPTRPGRARLLAPGTLNRQLVVRITLIVTAIAVLLAAVSTLLVGRILTRNLDDQLSYAVRATEQRPHGPGGPSSPGGPGGPSNPDGPKEGLRSGGLPAGSISLLVDATGAVHGQVTGELGTTAADATQIAALLALPRDAQVHTITINGYGRYRAVGCLHGDRLLIAAAPLQITGSVIARMLQIEALLIVLAAFCAAGISGVVVRNSLRPLNRLACTASTVAELPLASGEVDLGVRVPGDRLDPRSEVGKVGQAFNTMLDHVETALRARQSSETRVRQFVADASHELRNPLAAIRGYAELTRRGRHRLPEDTVFALGRIEAESQRMSRLVEQMLLLARLDNDPDLVRTEVDLAEIALNAVADARAASPQHRWQVAVPDNPAQVLGDANQLHQVLANLLGNARKHTPPGTMVRTTVDVQDGWVRMRVRDDGPGVPAELAASVFERFARADTARSHDREGSTGLGLAIVAAVAKAHGGRVELGTRPTHGEEPGFSEFTVWLPALAR